jgi:hypothetical protein
LQNTALREVNPGQCTIQDLVELAHLAPLRQQETQFLGHLQMPPIHDVISGLLIKQAMLRLPSAFLLLRLIIHKQALQLQQVQVLVDDLPDELKIHKFVMSVLMEIILVVLMMDCAKTQQKRKIVRFLDKKKNLCSSIVESRH